MDLLLLPPVDVTWTSCAVATNTVPFASQAIDFGKLGVAVKVDLGNRISFNQH